MLGSEEGGRGYRIDFNGTNPGGGRELLVCVIHFGHLGK